MSPQPLTCFSALSLETCYETHKRTIALALVDQRRLLSGLLTILIIFAYCHCLQNYLSAMETSPDVPSGLVGKDNVVFGNILEIFNFHNE